MLLYAAISKISCHLENISPINLGFLNIAYMIANCAGPTGTLLLCNVRKQSNLPVCMTKFLKCISEFTFSNSTFKTGRVLFANVCHTSIRAKKLQSVSNYYLCTLKASDFVLSLFLCTLYFDSLYSKFNQNTEIMDLSVPSKFFQLEPGWCFCYLPSEVSVSVQALQQHSLGCSISPCIPPPLFFCHQE